MRRLGIEGSSAEDMIDLVRDGQSLHKKNKVASRD